MSLVPELMYDLYDGALESLGIKWQTACSHLAHTVVVLIWSGG
jgi:hypothetical protein